MDSVLTPYTPRMRAAEHLVGLAAALCVTAGLVACGSTEEVRESAEPWHDRVGTVPGSFSELGYNLSCVATWDVWGSWIEVKSPDGTARKAVGEGPHKVMVQINYEGVPRVHEVGTGTVVGISGPSLLIEDPTE